MDLFSTGVRNVRPMKNRSNVFQSVGVSHDSIMHKLRRTGESSVIYWQTVVTYMFMLIYNPSGMQNKSLVIDILSSAEFICSTSRRKTLNLSRTFHASICWCFTGPKTFSRTRLLRNTSHASPWQHFRTQLHLREEKNRREKFFSITSFFIQP